MKPWLALVAGAVAIALLAGAYLYGRGDGAAIERDKQDAIEKATVELRAQREQLVDQLGGIAATRQAERQAKVREIVRESRTVTERPVYRNVCIDADGMQLLVRSAAAANGADPGIAAAGAGESAPAPPQP
jgi:DNA-directed RNA polymerase subunit H (RpoH/RPB5)